MFPLLFSSLELRGSPLEVLSGCYGNCSSETSAEDQSNRVAMSEQWWLQTLVTSPEKQLGRRSQRSLSEMQYTSRECRDIPATSRLPTALTCPLYHELKEVIRQSHDEIGGQRSSWEEMVPTSLFGVNVFRIILGQWSFQEHTRLVHLPSEIWDIHMQDMPRSGLCSALSTIWRH